MRVVNSTSGQDRTEQASLRSESVKKYFCSKSLFNGSHEIIILHGKEQYRLRRTRQNKLILTK